MNTLKGETSINIGEKEFPVLINLNALYLFSEEKNVELKDLDKYLSGDPLSFVPDVIFHGIMNHSYFHGTEKPEINRDQLNAVLRSDVGEITRIAEVIARSLLGSDDGGHEGVTEGNA